MTRYIILVLTLLLVVQQFGFADYLARRAADPGRSFRRHLRERSASIEE
jgi:hypothetical protein